MHLSENGKQGKNSQRIRAVELAWGGLCPFPNDEPATFVLELCSLLLKHVSFLITVDLFQWCEFKPRHSLVKR